MEREKEKVTPDNTAYMYDRRNIIIHTIYCHEEDTKAGVQIIKSRDYIWIKKPKTTQ